MSTLDVHYCIFQERPIGRIYSKLQTITHGYTYDQHDEFSCVSDQSTYRSDFLVGIFGIDEIRPISITKLRSISSQNFSGCKMWPFGDLAGASLCRSILLQKLS